MIRRGIETAKCTADPAYFLTTYGVIDDAQGHGEGTGTMPFTLWPTQIHAIWTLMASMKVIFLKARQLGISWLCCGYALWVCMFGNGKVVLLLSRREDDARELLRRVQVLYDRLPPWLKLQNPYAKPPNTKELLWANGSRCRALPADSDAGRSLTATLVILDEFAIVQDQEGLIAATKPTVDNGGQIIILSTAKGVGNLFHQIYARAKKGINGFTAMFLGWWCNPIRDIAWYTREKAQANDPTLFSQEYPCDDIEAFRATGSLRFPYEWVEAQKDNVREGIIFREIPGRLRGLPGMTFYQAPRHGRRYLVAADVAEGLEDGDYSSALVIDLDTWEEVADIEGKWETDEFADYLAELGELYDCLIVPERNNHGHAVLSRLRAVCPNRIALGDDEREGWHTNTRTKPIAVDELAIALRDGLCIVRTPATIEQLAIYQRNPNGKTSAPDKFHDDRVMKWAIALGWIRLCGDIGSITVIDDPDAYYRG